MNTKNNFCVEYNSKSRLIARIGFWALFSLFPAIAFFIHKTSIVVGYMAFIVFWRILTLPAYSCPNCGYIIGAPRGKDEKGNSFPFWTFMMPSDGCCPVCHVILKKKKIGSNKEMGSDSDNGPDGVR